MQCAVFDTHAYTNKSTFDIRKETKFITIKVKEKKNRKQTNDITVYIVNGITFHKKQLIVFHAYFTTSTKQRHINITDK